ncbi:MAG: class I SAM-dependent methyltransferase [Treponema sp.]|nr:class I SAM-dependent methyltransferase [Treponema sp.]
MEGNIELKLGDVQTTALIPVAVKANESLRRNARIHDDVAVQIVRTLGIDTAHYDKFMSHEGVIARTVMLDRMVKDFIAENPETVIVNLGAGFDNRFSRVDNGKILWFDIDLPDSIELRKKVFTERDRVTMLAGSVLDDGWCGPVKEEIPGSGWKVLFLAEGLFMYFTLDEIKKMIGILKINFPGATLIAEQNNPMMVKNQKYHDTVKNTNAVFKSGTWSGNEIASLVDGVHMTEEHSFNEEMRKHSFGGWLFATLLPKMNDRWARFEW